MCLHIQVRKLSLLGIAVAGDYYCMGLRSVSIAPRSCLLLRSEPSIVSFSWQGSLVIRLAAIVSINVLSRKNQHCFDRKKKFMSAVSFASLQPLGDSIIRHELLGFFEIWKVADLNLTDLHPKLRTVIYITCVYMCAMRVWASKEPKIAQARYGTLMSQNVSECHQIGGPRMAQG
jgi:hypothetical protein